MQRSDKSGDDSGDDSGSDSSKDSGQVQPAARSVAARGPSRRLWLGRLLRLTVSLVLLYLVGAYVLMPAYWKRWSGRHPSLAELPNVTETKFGIPGDPLNVALIGSESELQEAMQAAGWYPAAALGLRSDVRIAESTILKRPDVEAPVSSLYLFGRKEDLAYEQPVGSSPRQRHHVRFWKTERTDESGRTVWIGSASFDRKVGFSDTTGEITHHIAADVDAERDHLFQCLEQAKRLSENYVEQGFHKVLQGKNGGGDRWYTDGDLYVGVLN